MTEAATDSVYRRYGLYYPYFHIRDYRWLKVAALYWPKIVRIVPDGYPTQDSDMVRALIGDFLIRRPPGPSVEAIAPRFLDLVANHRNELRARLNRTQCVAALERGASSYGSSLAAVHASEMTPGVRKTLLSAGIAFPGHLFISPAYSSGPGNVIGLSLLYSYLTAHRALSRDFRRMTDWVVMHQDLAAVYKSVLAEDFAAANMLQPTTDQDDAYGVTNNWTVDQIAAVLLNRPGPRSQLASDERIEALGFLALELVVPDHLDTISIDQIIEIRDRYRSEFFAFGQAVDQAAASMADLSGIRDQAVLEEYLHDVVTVRFAQPLEELRNKMKQLTGDAATVSINVKTQLPAGAALAGGAWLSGHPLLAGTSAAAIGLMAIRRGVHEQRREALRSAPAASYLLHTQDYLRPRNLLNRTLHRLARIVGTSAD